MRRLSGRGSAFVVMLIASAGACSTAASTGQVVSPSPGLSLTASLDPGTLVPGNIAQLKVELSNTGSAVATIPGDGRCNPALQIIIWDSHEQIAWAQPLPLCAPPDQPQGPPPVTLAPGASLSAGQCFGLAANAGAGQCALLQLSAGTYRVGGSFHGMSLPRLQLTLE